MSDVFISYSRADRAFVRRLKTELESHDIPTWVDWEDIPPTSDWFDRVQRGILGAHTFLFVISPDSLQSEVCRLELDYASTEHKRVVPVLARDVGSRVVPESAGKRQWISFLDSDFESAFGNLLEAIETDLEWSEQHTHWLGLAKRWQTSERDGSVLLRGTELLAIEAWLARAAAESKQPEPTPLQVELAVVSRTMSRRRGRILAGVGVVTLAVTVVLGLLALLQRNTAREQRDAATSRALAASAFLELGSDPELSVLLGMEAVRADQTREAEDALRQALIASRIELTLSTPSGGLTDAEFDPNGESVVTAGEQGDARIWDANTGRELHVLWHHRDRPGDDQPLIGVDSVSFSPQGDKVLTAAADYTAKLWDADTGRRLAVLRDPEDYRILDARFSPDGRHVVTSTLLGQPRVWSAVTGKQTVAIPAEGAQAGAVAPDGRVLLTAGGICSGRCRASYPRLWRLPGGEPLAQFESDGGQVFFDAEFSSDGSAFVTAGGEGLSDNKQGSARIRSTDSGRLVGEVELPGSITDVAFSADASLVGAASAGGLAAISDASSGRTVATLSGHGQSVTSIDLGAGGLAATGSADGTARVWDVRTGVEVARMSGHGSPVTAVDLSPDGLRLLSAGGDGTARIWDTSVAGPAFGEGQATIQAGSGRSLQEGALSESGRYLATASHGEVVVRDTLNGDTTGNLDSASRVNGVLAISNDGRNAVIDGAGSDLDIASFSPSGERLATVTDRGKLSIRQAGIDLIELGRFAGVSGASEVGRIDVDDQVNRVAATIGTSIRVWEASGSGEVLKIDAFPTVPPRFSGKLTSVALSPDGRFVGGGALWDQEAGVWDTATGERVAGLSGHSGGVNDIQFTPDGTFAITAASDRTIRVWDLDGGRSLAALETGVDAASRIGFPPGGSALVALMPQSVKVFDCTVCVAPAELLAVAQGRLTRDLTEVERRRFLADLG